jgi:uncharacterized protein (DUF2249 family)
MTTSVTPIKASDKLQTLFERDERLIDVVAKHSPQLAKLRNSPMRRVMARVTTVAQAARLCKVSPEPLVRELNLVHSIDTAATDATPPAAPTAVADDSSPLPSFESAVELDVREELGKGGEPFSRIMAAVASLGEGQVLHLRAPFEPVPLFGVMAKRGFGHKTEQHADDDWSVWFFRQDAAKQEAAAAAAAAPSQPAAHATTSAATDASAETESSGDRTEVFLDVRNLEPPEPLVRTLEALENLPSGNVLVQINVRVPQFLLPILRERGFHFTIDETHADEVQVRIWRME